jgi:hypothetical protein
VTVNVAELVVVDVVVAEVVCVDKVESECGLPPLPPVLVVPWRVMLSVVGTARSVAVSVTRI